MKDLIERQAAIEAIMKAAQEIEDDIHLSLTMAQGARAMAVEIERLPSAQPEIIRCKDCKFWKKYGYINGKPEFLPKCGFNQIYTSKDDFCSRAERKGNERPD